MASSRRSRRTWTKLTDAEKSIFTEVTREAAGRATAQIIKREGELVEEFKKKASTSCRWIAHFQQAVLEEHHARVAGLRPQRLRPHSGGEVALSRTTVVGGAARLPGERRAPPAPDYWRADTMDRGFRPQGHGRRWRVSRHR